MLCQPPYSSAPRKGRQRWAGFEVNLLKLCASAYLEVEYSGGLFVVFITQGNMGRLSVSPYDCTGVGVGSFCFV